MPYDSTSALPEEVQDGLTASEQERWMDVFNAVHERTSDEDRAFRAAWSVVETANSMDLVEVPDKYDGIDLVPPEAAQDNALKALDWRDEHGDEVSAGTRTGWMRANQLASGRELSPDVIRRMAAFERHRKNSSIADEYEGEPWKDDGYVAWLLWGGDEGVEWAQRKSDELDRADEAAENADATDLGEQHRRWVPAFAVDQPTKHPAGDFETDAEFWSAIKYGFSKLTEHGYYPPILKQHKSDGKGKGPRTEEDGFVYGKIVDMGKRDGRYMWQIEAPEPVLEAIDEGWIENWSPSFYPKGWEHPHTGEALDAAPRHHAFVSVPHQKNIGPGSPFYSLYELEEAEMADEKDNEEHGDKDMQEYMDKQREMMEGMGSTLAKIEEMLSLLTEDYGGDGEGEEMEEPEEMAELREQNKELQEALRNERIKRRTDKVKAVAPDLEETELAEVVELAETDPDAYADRLVELAQAGNDAPKSTRQPEIGTQGNAPGGKTGREDRYEDRKVELMEQGYSKQDAIAKAWTESAN